MQPYPTQAVPRAGGAMNLETRLVGDQLLTVREVAKLLKVSRRTVWRWRAQGRLPAPIHCSKTCVRWKASVLQAFLQALKSG